jgi:hypothetical protein
VKFTQEGRVMWAYQQPEASTADLVEVRSGATSTVDATFPEPGDLAVTATVGGAAAPVFCAHAYRNFDELYMWCTDDGTVEFPGISPGTYRVTVEVSGYAETEVDDVTVTSGRLTTLAVPVE